MTSNKQVRRGLTPYQQRVILERLRPRLEDGTRSLFTAEVASLLGLSNGTVTTNRDALGGVSSSRKGNGASLIFYPDLLADAVENRPETISRPTGIPNEDPTIRVVPPLPKEKVDTDTLIADLRTEVDNLTDLVRDLQSQISALVNQTAAS